MNREDNRSPTKGITPRLVLGLTIMAAGVFLASGLTLLTSHFGAVLVRALIRM